MCASFPFKIVFKGMKTTPENVKSSCKKHRSPWPAPAALRRQVVFCPLDLCVSLPYGVRNVLGGAQGTVDRVHREVGRVRAKFQRNSVRVACSGADFCGAFWCVLVSLFGQEWVQTHMATPIDAAVSGNCVCHTTHHCTVQCLRYTLLTCACVWVVAVALSVCDCVCVSAWGFVASPPRV